MPSRATKRGAPKMSIGERRPRRWISGPHQCSGAKRQWLGEAGIKTERLDRWADSLGYQSFDLLRRFGSFTRDSMNSLPRMLGTGLLVVLAMLVALLVASAPNGLRPVASAGTTSTMTGVQ